MPKLDSSIARTEFGLREFGPRGFAPRGFGRRSRGRSWIQSGRLARRGLVLMLAIGIGITAVARPAAADGYDSERSGNPLRIVYYVVYPVGFLLDRLIFRPAYYIGQCEPFHSLFGTTRHPEDLEDPPPPALEEGTEPDVSGEAAPASTP